MAATAKRRTSISKVAFAASASDPAPPACQTSQLTHLSARDKQVDHVPCRAELCCGVEQRIRVRSRTAFETRQDAVGGFVDVVLGSQHRGSTNHSRISVIDSGGDKLRNR